ncbi:hypothetical protein [Reinekea blandensis]|uniref:Lipoprotein n=1 Tax=Reinekea blandensis MED297 TaxID=314283 RepID=A4BID3_9GAMM|nr:hypothetical protein [Reinekea blandensis]EAR08140.1 hypothetical protein MED297_00590 [Reinekea sp. MED297] [Reinekea blandensis MED297]
MKNVLLLAVVSFVFMGCSSIPTAYSGQSINEAERATVWVPTMYKKEVNDDVLSLYATAAYIPPGANTASFMDFAINSLSNQKTTYTWDIAFNAAPGHTYYFFKAWSNQSNNYVLLARDLGKGFEIPKAPFFGGSEYEGVLNNQKSAGKPFSFEMVGK